MREREFSGLFREKSLNKREEAETAAGGIRLNEYKETQIIKHALEYYGNRPGASQKEKAQEKRLFHKYNEKANNLRKRYGI